MERCRAGAFCEHERASPWAGQGDSPACRLSSSHWGWVHMTGSVTQNNSDNSATHACKQFGQDMDGTSVCDICINVYVGSNVVQVKCKKMLCKM